MDTTARCFPICPTARSAGRGPCASACKLVGAVKRDRPAFSPAEWQRGGVEKGLAVHGAGGRADTPREKVYRLLHVPPSLQEREKLKRIQLSPRRSNANSKLYFCCCSPWALSGGLPGDGCCPRSTRLNTTCLTLVPVLSQSCPSQPAGISASAGRHRPCFKTRVGH